MSEEALAVPSKPKKPTKRASLLSAENLRAAADVLSVGLSLLEGNRKTRPYARALRVATTIGANVVPEPKTFEKLKATRAAMKQLENPPVPLTKEQKRQLRQLNDQVLVFLDLYLEDK